LPLELLRDAYQQVKLVNDRMILKVLSREKR